ncbi:hypothetical protein KKJ25_12250 [Xenorhabdus bovienii]|uniref:Phage protein n=1 Tax=Xenorhabdus bovienii str. oregonense TaxID=1398202 RepID=A0A077P1I4_XENBV|nr:hypothetical protein [Xenorhabdus bovienii]MDE1495696.1 hypothetical protein [Xenorhabdus bovienii]MDE9464666.1 hypothetical protein [Xenorhabdus bovienii]MDE9466398.1 hypothetical protein [Xenorhabdus bovienii]MDE9475286.1 hypothetical protein [Xenorhabdus bovienii]MDE9533699.1 hypothetical protein [Xenorhabdus bovienii]
MQPHQQRVIDELTELNEKIEKLSDFIGGAIYNGLDETDRVLLAMQLSVMKAYSEILHKRINRF